MFTAPPGAGKTSVINAVLGLNREINELLKQQQLPPVALTFTPGVTTRPMRPGEKAGFDFQFLTEAHFQKRERRGDFLFTWIDPYRYAVDGTDLDLRLRNADPGTILIYNLNAWMVPKLKRLLAGRPLAIFLNAPSVKELESRKLRRSDMTPEQLEFRRRRMRDEIRQGKKIADAAFVNAVFEQTVGRCLAFIFSRTILPNFGVRGPRAKRILRQLATLVRSQRRNLRQYLT